MNLGGIHSAIALVEYCRTATTPADVAELADAQDLGSCGATHVGSNPTVRIYLFAWDLGLATSPVIPSFAGGLLYEVL